MYSFILNMYVTGQIDEAKVYSYASKGFITTEQADMIVATPQTV